MIKEIVRDIDFLEKPLEKAESIEEVKDIIVDMLDTARFHTDRCLGMAANQIGSTKRVIVVKITEKDFITMINPVIVKESTQWYVATESCMSLVGERKVMRKRWVDIMYRDAAFKIKSITFVK